MPSEWADYPLDMLSSSRDFPPPPNVTATEIAVLEHVGGWFEFCEQCHFDTSDWAHLPEAWVTLQEVARGMDNENKAAEERKDKENKKEVTKGTRKKRMDQVAGGAGRPESGYHTRTDTGSTPQVITLTERFRPDASTSLVHGKADGRSL